MNLRDQSHIRSKMQTKVTHRVPSNSEYDLDFNKISLRQSYSQLEIKKKVSHRPQGETACCNLCTCLLNSNIQKKLLMISSLSSSLRKLSLRSWFVGKHQVSYTDYFLVTEYNILAIVSVTEKDNKFHIKQAQWREKKNKHKHRISPLIHLDIL